MFFDNCKDSMSILILSTDDLPDGWVNGSPSQSPVNFKTDSNSLKL